MQAKKTRKEPEAEPEMPGLPWDGMDNGLSNLRSIGVQPRNAGQVPELRGDGEDISAAPCERCGGSGWEHVAGGVQRCRCHHELTERKLLERIGVPPRFVRESLASYRPHGPTQSLALVKAKGFVAQWPMNRSAGLAFIGSVGTGKTHLAASIVRQLSVQKKVVCAFAVERALTKAIQDNIGTRARSESEILRPILEAELAVIDELGAVKVTEWVFDLIEHILSTRYNDGKATIITSNLPLLPAHTPTENRMAQAVRQETLGDRIGSRMYSRLREMCEVVEVEGKDMRERGPAR